MNNIIYCIDINLLIASFIYPLENLIIWAFLCKFNYSIAYEINFFINKIPNNSHFIIKHFSVTNDIKAITLRKLSNIQSLICNRNVTNYTLSKMTNLTYLHLNSNKIITNKTLGLLKNLKTLYLSNDTLLTENSIKLLTNLENLHCGNNNKLTDNLLNKLTSLQYLYTGFNYFTNIGFKNLHNLKVL
jgi:hypothetical protein